MVSDQEPRYRLVDDEGNIVGSLYGKADGSIAIQETDSGADREVTLAPDGTFSAPSGDFDSVTTERATIANQDFEEIYNETFEDETIDENIDVSGYDEWEIIIRADLEQGDDIKLRIDDEDSSNYDYFLHDGTTKEGFEDETEFIIVSGDPDANIGVSANVKFKRSRGRLTLSGDVQASKNNLPNSGLLDWGNFQDFDPDGDSIHLFGFGVGSVRETTIKVRA